MIAVAAATGLGAQGRANPPASPAPSARAAAPIDLTGFWVSVVTEDWRWRMLTPARGDFAGVPLNAAGRALGNAWDPAKDEAAGTQCKAYGAPAIMRVPGRLRITWQDDSTLKIETDSGIQTRLLRFAPPQGRDAPSDRSRGGAPPAATAEATWQGRSVAQWEPLLRGPGAPDFVPIALNPRAGTGGRTLEVVTTNLRPGYLRRNGVPYGAKTTLREYFVLTTERNGDVWFVVTTIVEDPEHLATPFVTTTNFKKQADGTGWSPTPCSAR